jgi:demethylmenaquinone methyltransferase/2-methoxy-6-polyprenyl-1,4-benzoquinol methylase
VPQTTQTPAWTDESLADPHAVADKAKRVERMFAAIAPSYDLNNRLHSMGRDQAWRKAAVRAADVKPGDVVLDVACGTGDLTMAFADRSPAQRVIGMDFTYNMLAVAKRKGGRCHYAAADAMNLPLPDSCVDVVSIAFGIRNVADPAKAIAEFHRVLRPGGRMLILEFTLPRHALLRKLYLFYFNHIMPRTAALIARDRSGAYRYLPRSVGTFIEREQLVARLEAQGFDNVTTQSLTCGIAALYRAIKPLAA